MTLATGYAGGPAGMKDAASAVLTAVSVTADGADATANLKRPVAKYVLVADDVDDFLKSSGTRQLSQLTATVECEGFFPSAYNVAGDRPCDSSTGYAYSCRLSPDGLTDGKLPIAADWVMVNGDESYINLTVTITDGEGRLVARHRGVTVPYRRGCLTTVSGHFLTAGGGSGGIGLEHKLRQSFHYDAFQHFDGGCSSGGGIQNRQLHAAGAERGGSVYDFCGLSVYAPSSHDPVRRDRNGPGRSDGEIPL